MGLPTAEPSRQLKHRRQIDVQVYTRGNGLWEVDARITDVKTRELQLASGPLPPGEPLHDMQLRLVIDEAMNILEAGARSLAMPYPGYCDQYGDAYGQLVGLNLLRGFRHALQARLGGVQGCTHLTEMAQVLPTAVIQAFAGEVVDVQDGHATHEGGAPGGPPQPPFQLDRCHALRRDGPGVQVHYPRWYRAPGSDPSRPPKTP